MADHVHSLSGLAWDADDNILYAISDRGDLYHLSTTFESGYLTSVSVVNHYSLQSPQRRPLKWPVADSEGLALINSRNGKTGDARLVVSFESVPRIVVFDRKGNFHSTYEAPEGMRRGDAFRHPNKSFEAVAIHPTAGILLGPEQGLANEPARSLRLVNPGGATWPYELLALPNSALVAMEALPDGSLVTLERAHSWLYIPFYTSFRHTSPLRMSNVGRSLETKTLAVLDSSVGWALDNFEGLALHEGNRFFISTDNNRKAFQRTILAYVELTNLPPLEFRLRAPPGKWPVLR